MTTESDTCSEPMLANANMISEDILERGHARRMGHLENYFALLQRQDLYGNFTTYCEFESYVDIETLVPILREIFFQNPILVHTIIPKNYPNHEEFYLSEQYLEKPYPEHDYIKIIPHLGLNDIIINKQEEYKDVVDSIIKRFNDDACQITCSLTEMISNIRIPICLPNRPNWRLLILFDQKTPRRFKHIVYISNHCSSDAMSGINIFKDINKGLAVLGKEATNISTDTIDNDYGVNNNSRSLEIYDYDKDYTKFKRLAIPITERVDYRPNWIAMGKLMVTSMIMKYLVYKFKDSETKRIKEDRRENFHYNINIGWDQVQQLKTNLQRHKSSMTGFLQACLFIVLNELGVFKDRRWNEMGVDISIPNDHRKSLPKELVEEQYKYGANVAGSHYSFLISSIKRNQIWELSQYYTEVIQNADYNVGLGALMLDFVYKNQNVDKIITDSYLGNQRGGIILSNIGLHTDESGNNKGEDDEKETFAGGIKDLKFIQNVGTLGFSLVVNVCSTKKSGMNVCVSGIEGTIGDREKFNATFKELENLIRGYCE